MAMFFPEYENQWIQFSVHHSSKLDSMEIDEKYEFSITDHDYTFYKKSKNSGIQIRKKQHLNNLIQVKYKLDIHRLSMVLVDGQIIGCIEIIHKE